MRKQIYLAITERLKNLKDVNDNQVIKHFDLWNLNVEFIEQETPFNMPAVFIEFAAIDWKTLSGGIQQADITVMLHVITRWHGTAADGASTREDALAYFDLLDQINKAMFGLKGEGFSAFKRVKSFTNHNHEEIIESIESYSTFVVDR